jgi:hypothetical protein
MRLGVTQCIVNQRGIRIAECVTQCREIVVDAAWRSGIVDGHEIRSLGRLAHDDGRSARSILHMRLPKQLKKCCGSRETVWNGLVEIPDDRWALLVEERTRLV